ncbi:MAG: mechanosensitive ion channel family protein [Persicimonas sp.]
MEDQTSQLLELQDVLFGYANDFLQTLPSLLLGVLVLVLFVAFAGLAKKLATRAAERLTDDPSLQSLFGQVTRVVFLAVGVFASAAVIFPGLSAGHLVSVLGLSSVAIGFAFKDIFQNFLAGILILSQRPFKIGDQIETSSLEGTVEHISIRNTLIKTYDGQRLIVPNAQIFTNPITVRTAFDKRRTTFSTGIGYGDDIEQAREVIAGALADCDQVLDEPTPQVVVTEHGDSSVNFDIRYWTQPAIASVVKGRDQVATAVKYALDDAGIEMPYPYRSVEFMDLTERDGA